MTVSTADYSAGTNGLAINWDRAAPEPVAVVFLPWENGGVTICHRNRCGALHGCRDKTRNETFAECVSAWARGAREDGLQVEDLAGCLADRVTA